MPSIVYAVSLPGQSNVRRGCLQSQQFNLDFLPGLITLRRMSNVTIVGAVLMGTAMAWPLSDNGHHVRLVGTHLDKEIIASCLDKRFHPRLRPRLRKR